MHIAGLSVWWWLKTAVDALLVGALILAGLCGEAWAVPGWLLTAGQLLVFLGAAINLWHYAILKKQAHYLGKPDKLVTSGGLFRMVRHPMYLGELLLVTGLTLMLWAWWAVMLWGLFTVSVLRLVRIEDDQMAGVFGDDHRAWVQRTRLMLPWLW